MKKPWVKIAAGVVALLVLLFVVAPLFVNADSFRPMLEAQLSSALGRKVTLGKLSFSLWSGSVVADTLTVADDPAFGATPFLQAKSLKIGVDTGAFLFHHQVNVRKIVAESPEIHLISNQQGAWNYATLGHGGAAGSQPAGGTVVNVTVGVLEVDDGKVVVSSIPTAGQAFVCDAVKIKVQNVSFDQTMPFSMTANLPAGGSLAVNGTAGPLNQQDASATPLNAKVTVKGFDPVKAGVVPASAGIAMVANVDAQLTSDGKTAVSTGTIVAEHLVLAKGGSPAPNPVKLTYAMRDDLKARTGQVTDLAFQTGAVAAHVTGTFAMTGPAVALNLHVSARQLPVDAVEEFLPAAGVRLPSGSQLKGGTLTAQLSVTGTPAALVIAGPIEVDNTQLAGFDLGSKIQGLKALTGSGGGTGIQTLKAEVRQTQAGTELTNIDAVVPALGTATGNGTVSATGALNFQLSAKLSGAGAAGAIVGSLLHAAGNVAVPVTITGTTSNPVIRADVGAIVKGGLGVGKKGLGGLVQGLIPK
jgi:AsmA protein